MTTQLTPNPFLDDIFLAGSASPALGAALDEPTVESMHADALRKLAGHVANLANGAGGAVILLRSSRAGFGKSHLLERLVAARKNECFFVPLDVNRDTRPTWTGMLQGVLVAGAQVRQATPRVSFLESMGRKLMAEAASDLILRGDVPSGDPARAIAMLKRDYLRAFDMRGGGSEVARWMAGNFTTLLPLMGAVLASRAMIGEDEAVAWLRVLARFNAGGAAERKAVLDSVALFGDEGAAQAGAKQRLRSFCRLAALDRPLVLVFDHIDALAGAKRDAMQLTCMLGELGRQRFGVGAILAVNGDVWGSSFDGHLPGALEDRLTGREVRLGGIDLDGSEALVRLRLGASQVAPAEVEDFLREAKLAEVMERRWAGAAAPRDVLRHAAKVWDRLMDPASAGASNGSQEWTDAPEAGESVKDYLPGKLPQAASLAEPSTLRPMREVIGSGGGRACRACGAGESGPGDDQADGEYLVAVAGTEVAARTVRAGGRGGR